VALWNGGPSVLPPLLGPFLIQIDSQLVTNKNGPGGTSAEAIKVFILETARWSSGYPSGAVIEAGKSGNVGPIVNRTRKFVGLAAPHGGAF